MNTVTVCAENKGSGDCFGLPRHAGANKQHNASANALKSTRQLAVFNNWLPVVCILDRTEGAP